MVKFIFKPDDIWPESSFDCSPLSETERCGVGTWQRVNWGSVLSSEKSYCLVNQTEIQKEMNQYKWYFFLGFGKTTILFLRSYPLVQLNHCIGKSLFNWLIDWILFVCVIAVESLSLWYWNSKCLRLLFCFLHVWRPVTSACKAKTKGSMGGWNHNVWSITSGGDGWIWKWLGTKNDRWGQEVAAVITYNL